MFLRTVLGSNRSTQREKKCDKKIPIAKTPAKNTIFPDKLWLNTLLLTNRLYPNTRLRNPQSTFERCAGNPFPKA